MKMFVSYRSEFPIYIIIAFAFLVRAVGINFGLPYLYHPDEPLYVNPALNMIFTGDLNPHWFHHPGSFVIYLLAILFAVVLVLYYVSCLLDGHVYNLTEFKHLIQNNPIFYYDKNPFLFHFLGRILILLFAVITVYLVYLVAKKIFNRQVGLLGAFCLSISPLHVTESRYIRPDIPATMLVMFSLYFLFRFMEKSKDTKWLILSSLFGGFSIATKYTSGIIVFPILAHCFISDFKSLRLSKAGYLKDFFKIKTGLSKVLLYIFIGFFMCAPFFVLDFSHSIRSFIEAINWQEIGHDRLPGIWNHIWYLTTPALRGIGGVFFALFAFQGFYLVLLKRSYTKLMFLVFPILYFLAIGAGRLKWDRWFIPVLPFEAILFGVGFYATYRLFIQAEEFRAQKPKLFLLFIIIMIGSSFYIIKSDIIGAICLTRLDTRTIAKEWVEANLPDGAKIAYEGNTVPLDIKSKGNLRLLAVPEGITFRPLSYYQQQSVDYIMATSYLKRRLKPYPNKYADQLVRYEWLYYKTQLIKLIDKENHPGPEILIFKLNNALTEKK